ncbi:LruC domain-containing protein, partial [Parabacteroides sp. OttesenSCG-928-N08]|nr:LruC domain-containing protein [Parabacteroides sp. OttesenSCG-928-N08]
MNCFRQINKAKTAGLSLLSLLLVTVGCIEKDIYEPNPEIPSQEDFFDFATSGGYKLEVDYCVSNYPIMFQLFANNPLVVDGGSYLFNEDEKPLYRAVTDKNGKFTTDIILPSYTQEVYLYTNYLGVDNCVKLHVAGNTIRFNQQEFSATTKSSGIVTRGTTSSGHTYPDRYKVLGDWELHGMMDYMEPEKRELDPDFLTRIRKTFVDKNVKYDATYVGTDRSMDLHIAKATKVHQVFLNTSAAYANSYGYYIYPTNNPPQSPDEIEDMIISFPYVNYWPKSGVAHCEIREGDQVMLQYWNKEKQQFEDTFPAGVSIGFFILPGAFDISTGNIQNKTLSSIEKVDLPKPVPFIFYSNNRFNNKLDVVGQKEYQRTVAAYDGDHMVVLCFEDRQDCLVSNGMWAYNDAVFYFHIEQSDAIEPTIPELPGEVTVPSTDNNYVEHYGTLAFEDLWPSQGDYDMNDVVVSYNSTLYKDPKTNKVVKVVDEFTPVFNGASYTNGFGYQYHKLSSADIKSVTIATESGITSTFMKGASLEPGQDKPTIILCDNIKEAISKNARFTVTTEFHGVDEANLYPPYNPFIIVRSDEGRQVEVHLTNYPPTSLADKGIFGTHTDHSSPDYGIYYVSDNNFPFAINLFRDDSFIGAPEGKRIDTAFPLFTGWATSF